jgi:hypothetical protein
MATFLRNSHCIFAQAIRVLCKDLLRYFIYSFYCAYLLSYRHIEYHK